MTARKRLAEEFFRSVFGPEGGEYGDYRLAWVSDEATLHDVNGSADDADVIERVRRHYGVDITTADFCVPFWQLLDRLNAHRPQPRARRLWRWRSPTSC
jgi:hypothetical protein